MGVFGAMAVYTLVNDEPAWNPRGCAARSAGTVLAATALIWLAGMPTLGAEHVVNNTGHLAGFTAGGAMAYAGLAPRFSTDRVIMPPPPLPSADRAGAGAGRSHIARLDPQPRLVDLATQGRDKLYVGLGAASTVLAAESVLVLIKRFVSSHD
mmetsp:Transcript_15303/g.37688  ORF Transcript_15303/g.37688 Transcript_15303/m.37688 type:complete len:153 (-) Transcript_15303:81-539(-)